MVILAVIIQFMYPHGKNHYGTGFSKGCAVVDFETVEDVSVSVAPLHAGYPQALPYVREVVVGRGA
jgi:hypothetical protein